MEHKVIRIECQGAESISIDDLTPFQDDLKSLSKENYEKIKKEIVKNGFSEPISIWRSAGRNYVLNGHQRIRALSGLRDDGYDVDKIPVSFVAAKTEKEAKRKILGLAGQYGKVEKDELYKFAVDYDLDIEEVFEHVRFPEIDSDDFLEEFTDAGESDGHANLAEKFGAPPFSVLDTRQGYWQERKRQWLSLGIQSELGRGGGSSALTTPGTGKMAMHNDPMVRMEKYGKP